MPDISPIHPVNHLEKADSLTSYKKLQQKSTLLTEALSSKERSDRFGLEIIDQINNRSLA